MRTLPAKVITYSSTPSGTNLCLLPCPLLQAQRRMLTTGVTRISNKTQLCLLSWLLLQALLQVLIIRTITTRDTIKKPTRALLCLLPRLVTQLKALLQVASMAPQDCPYLLVPGSSPPQHIRLPFMQTGKHTMGLVHHNFWSSPPGRSLRGLLL